MGIWSWFKNRVDHFIHDPTDNVNNGLIANPFLVKETPDADHYQIGGEFGDIEGALQRTSTEFWVAADTGKVHVGLKAPDEMQPSYALAAVMNGTLRLVPAGQTLVVPRTDRMEASKVVVHGPAYVLEGLDTAVASFREKLNADVWIEAGLAPQNRPLPAVVVYENVEITDDLDELVKTWYRIEKKLPFWTDARIDELAASWKNGESTVYVQAGYPIGQPAANPPAGITRPPGLPLDSRYVVISLYDEFGAPIDLGWLLRHADLHAGDELSDNLVAPNAKIFRKSPLRDKMTRRDIIDLRDEYGLPYRNRTFRLFTEAEFPVLSSVFDKAGADLVLASEPKTTGAAGLWQGLEVNAGDSVVVQGVGLKDHLLGFLPSCSSSSVVIRVRGYPGDYHRIIAFNLHKWYPEQPNARADFAPKRLHLGCRATPLVDGQTMHAVVFNAIRATYERGAGDPADPANLRPAADRSDARVWLVNWQISPATFGYGGSATLYADAAGAAFEEGRKAYPEACLGFYLQSAIAAGVDVRLMPWYNIFYEPLRDQNIEIARAVNQYYDASAYHTPTGPSDVGRDAIDVTGMNPIPANFKRGFGFVDNNTRGMASHHQKVSFIRNRYGNYAFLGGIDLTPGRWDTNEHHSPETRKPFREPPRTGTQGWHDVHVMLEGPVVRDVANNFLQRWNAFVADPPGLLTDYPVDLNGVTAIQNIPDIPQEGVPHWPGPVSDRAPDAPLDPDVAPNPDTELDRGEEGRRTRRATQVCAIVRTIPPFIDAYNSFVKARPIPNNGEPLGELGCRASYKCAMENARHYVYIEDQYFVEPELIDILLARLTDPDPKTRLRRLFVVLPHILADQKFVDAIYHHFRTQHTLRIREAVRAMLATERGVDPIAIPQIDVDSIFTVAHLEHPSGEEIYVHAKHMIVDDLWMVISSSNISKRGMTYETEIGVAITDAEIEDGVRKAVRDHRIRLWAEHLRLDRSHWHRLLDPMAGAELLRQGLDNPNLPLIPFEVENDHILLRYSPENHSATHDLIYRMLADPDGREIQDPVDVDLARQALAAIP